MPRLENWSMVSLLDPYKAPELQFGFLRGIVYDHMRLEDGELIVTSVLVDIDIEKGTAKTFSGSDYILGKPDVKWMDFLKENGYTDYLKLLEKLTSKFVN